MAISSTIKVTAAGTSVQAASKGNARSLVFKARIDNTGTCYLGGSDVSASDGMSLVPASQFNWNSETHLDVPVLGRRVQQQRPDRLHRQRIMTQSRGKPTVPPLLNVIEAYAAVTGAAYTARAGDRVLE